MVVSFKLMVLFYSNKPQDILNPGLIEVDIIRQDNLAYEYLCHLEETKVYVFIEVLSYFKCYIIHI